MKSELDLLAILCHVHINTQYDDASDTRKTYETYPGA
jgi:hypothetical protein